MGTILATAALDGAELRRAVESLTTIDDDLAGIVRRHGQPPLWDRPPGFETLVAIILEQQVSLRSGAAALERLRVAAGGLDPAVVARLGGDGSRAAGLTRQKARYVVHLAEATLDGRFDPDVIAMADDETARAGLTALLGVGRWTADIYLLMALGRPDVWPVGDLALAAALRRAKRLGGLPSLAEQDAIALEWRARGAGGARLPRHAYLAGER